MSTNLPREVQNRLIRFLVPYMDSVNYRETLLVQAFTGTKAVAHLETIGPSSQFTPRMVEHLQKFGFVEGRPALLRLLETFNEHIEHPDFDAILTEVRDFYTYPNSDGYEAEDTATRSTSEEPLATVSPPDPTRHDEEPRSHSATARSAAVLTVEMTPHHPLSTRQQHRVFTAFETLLYSVARQINNTAPIYNSRVGDSISLILFSGDNALDIALTFAEQVHNTPKPRYRLRVGLHMCNVFISENEEQGHNVRGPEIQVAQRVMEFAEPGQILASVNFCEGLNLLNGTPPPVDGLAVDFFGDCPMRSGNMLKVYNLALPSVGLPLRDNYEAWVATFNRPIEQTMEDYKQQLVDYRQRREVRPDLDALKIAAIARRLLTLLPEVSLEESQQREHIVHDTIRQIRSATVGEGNIYYHYFLSNLGLALDYFFKVARLVRYHPDKVLFEQGQTPNVVLFIVAGRVQLTPQARDEGEGLIVGEAGLFLPDARHQVTAYALTDVIALALRYEDLDKKRRSARYHADIADIRRTLWEKVYTSNIMREVLMTHPLFSSLTTSELAELASGVYFYPRDLYYNGPPTIETLQLACLLVVTGEVRLAAKINSGGLFDIRFLPGEIVGMVHMAEYHFGDNSYRKYLAHLDWAQDTQLIILDWRQIYRLMEKNRHFHLRCVALYNETVANKWHDLLDKIPQPIKD